MTTNTVSAFVTASSTPPSAGPMKAPTDSSVLEATFAAVSSPGVRARCGSSAACAGRNTVPETVERPTMA